MNEKMREFAYQTFPEGDNMQARLFSLFVSAAKAAVQADLNHDHGHPASPDTPAFVESEDYLEVLDNLWTSVVENVDMHLEQMENRRARSDQNVTSDPRHGDYVAAYGASVYKLETFMGHDDVLVAYELRFIGRDAWIGPFIPDGLPESVVDAIVKTLQTTRSTAM
jgi:hypothetical protein